MAKTISLKKKRNVILDRKRVNLRTKFGREAKKTIDGYVKRRESAKLNVTFGMVNENPDVPLDKLLNIDVVDYQKNVKGRCICGQHVSKEIYRMRVRGVSRKASIESEVQAKIKARTPLSQVSRKSYVEFTLGKDCFKHLPELLSDFGYHGLTKKVTKGRKKKQKKLEQILIEDPSKELKERLEQIGVDKATLFVMLKELKDGFEFTEEGLLYELDPGKRNSFGNWFREGIKKGTIDNEEIVNSYSRLENASFLVKPKELAALATYAYEFRRFTTDAVIGGVKDDLTYLDGLSDDDELIKRYGKVNIDKHYVRPATRFRKRKGLEQVTIREKLEQSHLTFLEALGVKLHFPNIEGVRVNANRNLAEKYGKNWNYLLDNVKEVFGEVKKERKAEYKAFGKLVEEHVLTQDEYGAAKDFLKISKLGRGTERENYLRLYSIREFKEVAPKIMAIGRKIRYAKNIDDELLKEDFMRMEVGLKEDYSEDLGDKISKIADTILVNNQNFAKFQRDHGKLIGDLYDNGLVAKKYLKQKGKKKQSAIDKNIAILEKEGVKELDIETINNLNEIFVYSKMPWAIYEGELADIGLRHAGYITEKGRSKVKRTYSDFKKLFSKIGTSEVDIEKAKDSMMRLKKLGDVTYIREHEYSLAISGTSSLDSLRVFQGEVSAYNLKWIENTMNDVDSGVKADKRLLAKLCELNDNMALAAVGSKLRTWSRSSRESKNVYVSQGLKDRIEGLYEKLKKVKKEEPMKVSVTIRENLWGKADKKEKSRLARSLGNDIYTTLVELNKKMWEVINGTVDGYTDRARNFVRKSKPNYKPGKLANPRFAHINFLRFMGNGTEPVYWNNLASGKQTGFKINDKIRTYLSQDLENGLLNEKQFHEYSRRMWQFEDNVNNFLQKNYGLRKS